MSMISRLRQLYRALFGRDRAVQTDGIDFEQLSGLLQYQIRDRGLFKEALSHRSYLQVAPDSGAVSNERLEFLGDAILNLVVAEHLFRRDTDAPEGDLTKARSRLVSKKALTVLAREIRLGEFILLSPSASQMASRGMDTIIADAFEAIIGAIYLDGGFTHARKFVEQCLKRALDGGTLRTQDENFKSRLLEQVQAGGFNAPRYTTINEEGPDHDRTFTVEVMINGISYGIGHGKNKKDAEQSAAEKALHQFPATDR
jgi:ribonuclease III